MWYNNTRRRQGTKSWEHSSAGRASALQAEGHRFEPYCSHHFFGPVVQLVRTLACHARGRGFEPHSGRQLCASVAQSVEQGTENPRVVGSIPTGGTISADLAHLVERHLAKVEVAGSSPVIRSKKVHFGVLFFFVRIFKRISVMDLGKSIFLNHMSSTLLRLTVIHSKKHTSV